MKVAQTVMGTLAAALAATIKRRSSGHQADVQEIFTRSVV
jgi:hypothetical protein